VSADLSSLFSPHRAGEPGTPSGGPRHWGGRPPKAVLPNRVKSEAAAGLGALLCAGHLSKCSALEGHRKQRAVLASSAPVPRALDGGGGFEGYRARSVQPAVLACEHEEMAELLHHGGWSFLPLPGGTSPQLAGPPGLYDVARA
jgi:hypothetical protein